MIFVTVGTHPQSFNRLLKAIDTLIENGKIKEEVVMQIGHSTYEPKNARWFRFTDYKEIEKLNKEARLIISHGGAGCILTALSFDKFVIAVPRLKKFGEHTDNHQLDLVRVLEAEGKVIGVYNIKDLEKSLKTKKKIKTQRSKKLLKKIKTYLSKLSREYISACNKTKQRIF